MVVTVVARLKSSQTCYWNCVMHVCVLFIQVWSSSCLHCGMQHKLELETIVFIEQGDLQRIMYQNAMYIHPALSRCRRPSRREPDPAEAKLF